MLGLLVGSFLNVVIYRVPIMMDNALRAECAARWPIPTRRRRPAVQSHGAALGLPGVQGADHGAAEHPGGELARAAGANAPTARRRSARVIRWWSSRPASCRASSPGTSATAALALAALAFTWFLIALTMIDFDTQYLPDQLTYPLLWLGLLVSLWHPVWARGAAPVTPARQHHRRRRAVT